MSCYTSRRRVQQLRNKSEKRPSQINEREICLNHSISLAKYILYSFVETACTGVDALSDLSCNGDIVVVSPLLPLIPKMRVRFSTFLTFGSVGPTNRHIQSFLHPKAWAALILYAFHRSHPAKIGTCTKREKIDAAVRTSILGTNRRPTWLNPLP